MKAGFLTWEKSHDADQILLEIEAQFEEHIYGQICLFVCLVKMVHLSLTGL